MKTNTVPGTYVTVPEATLKKKGEEVVIFAK
jgi:hypothetical protein